MDKTSAEENLQLIREVMERSVRYTHFSGLSGVISGILGLAATAGTYWINNNPSINPDDGLVITMSMWGAVLILAITQDLIFAQRKARSHDQTIWNPATYQVMKSIVPGTLVAAVLSIGVLQWRIFPALPSIWALGYGAALCAAGPFAVRQVWGYGILQLVTGAAGILLLPHWDYSSLLVAGLSFGIYQILFGLWISRKYR